MSLDFTIFIYQLILTKNQSLQIRRSRELPSMARVTTLRKRLEAGSTADETPRVEPDEPANQAVIWMDSPVPLLSFTASV